MFRWFHSWREKRRLGPRGLFSFFDGTRTRWADPMRIWRGLLSHPKRNLEAMAPAIDAGEEPETTIFAEAVCEVFGVQRWNGDSGLTDEEITQLVIGLQTFLQASKKNTRP